MKGYTEVFAHELRVGDTFSTLGGDVVVTFIVEYQDRILMKGCRLYRNDPADSWEWNVNKHAHIMKKDQVFTNSLIVELE
jgi:hypothetical protein